MQGGGAAEDVVVEFELPESVSGAVVEIEFGVLFEEIDKAEEVGIVGGT